ncbi:unnamed protein product, partial [Rotaria sp. Silwood1]
MDKNSSTIELKTIENQFEIEVKDDINNEQSTDLLIEPIVTVHSDKPPELSHTIVTRLLGILYSLLATFIVTVSLFITKEIKIDASDALIPCYLLHSIILIIYMKFIKPHSLYKQASQKEILVLCIHAFCYSTGAFTFLFAFRYLTLPDLTTIRFTQIIWTAIMTSIIYREKPSISMIISILLTTIGVIFVAQPSFLFSKTSNINKNNTSNDYYQHLIGVCI